VQDAQLRRREPDAERVVHELPHPLDLSCQRVVESLDGQCLGPQHRVAQLAHVPQRRISPGAGLRIELRDRRRILLALDLDVGVIGRRSLELLQCVFVCHSPVSLGCPSCPGAPGPEPATSSAA